MLKINSLAGFCPQNNRLTAGRDTVSPQGNKIYIGVTYPIQASSEGIYLLLNTKLTKIPS